MASPFDHFVMAPAATQVPCPTVAAGFLMVHVTLLHPEMLTYAVNTIFHAAEDMVLIIHKTMAGVERATGINPKIPDPSPAGIRIMGSPMQFERGDHI